jgi:hypothetical protein
VLASDALRLPTGLRLGLPSSEVAWGVAPGDDVRVGAGRVGLPGGDVVAVRQWRPARGATPGGRTAAETPARGARALEGAGLSAVLRGLCADLAAEAQRSGRVEGHVAGLLGAGPGLTPSGDDALCGVLLALRAVGPLAAPGALPAVQAAVRAATPATTSLSASLLLAACDGYAVPELSRLAGAVAAGDERAASSSLSQVLAIGHTSGADLVAGLTGALDALVPTTVPHHTEPEGARRV